MGHKFLNARYALLCCSFFMLVCATMGYVYNFLSTAFYPDGAAVSDGTIGIIVTVINVCCVIVQTAVGDAIDKSERLDERVCIALIMAVTIALSLALMFVTNAGVLMFCVVILAFTASVAPGAIVNTIAFIYEAEGQSINFGVSRGLGSAAYAVSGMILGRLWAATGRAVLPVYIAVFAAIVAASAITLPKPRAKAPGAAQKDAEAAAASQMSYPQFLRTYSFLLPVVAALILLFFCHNLMNTYIAKLIANIIGAGAAAGDGAVEAIQGTAIFVQAISELPAMFLFAKIMERVRIERLLSVAAILYSVKHVLMLMANSPLMLYAAMLLQAVSYAIVIPCTVYLADKYVLAQDRNRGQALMSMTLTIGGLLASLVGGQLFVYLSSQMVFTAGVAISIAGSVLMVLSVRGLASHEVTA